MTTDQHSSIRLSRVQRESLTGRTLRRMVADAETIVALGRRPALDHEAARSALAELVALGFDGRELSLRQSEGIIRAALAVVDAHR